MERCRAATVSACRRWRRRRAGAARSGTTWRSVVARAVRRRRRCAAPRSPRSRRGRRRARPGRARERAADAARTPWRARGHTPVARAGSTASGRRLGRNGHANSVLPERGAGVSSRPMARALIALLGVLFVATRVPAKQVEVTVEGLLLDPSTGSPVVRLVEKSGSGKAAGDAPARELPIWIGPFEAQAIALEIQGVPPPRPLTHDLMKQLVERLGGKLERVEIFDLKDNTYLATLHVAGPGGKDLAIDARPSDAIALALRFHGPILVSDDLFAKSAATRANPAAAHLWGLTVQDLTPEMASFFQADDVQGVLVS